MGGAGGIIDQATTEIIEVPSPIAQLHVQVSFVASAHISLDNSRGLSLSYLRINIWRFFTMYVIKYEYITIQMYDINDNLSLCINTCLQKRSTQTD